MFDKALKRILAHEGGYVNHPDDPGGETNYGVTKKVAVAYGYTGSMKDIPMDIISNIYKQNYWDKMNCDQFHFAVAFQMFDSAVNHGTSRAAKFAQLAVGAKADGVIGPNSNKAIKSAKPYSFILQFNSDRVVFYTNLNTFKTFGTGWMRRVADNLDYAVEDLL